MTRRQRWLAWFNTGDWADRVWGRNGYAGAYFSGRLERMIRSARVGAEARERILHLASVWDLTLAETVRALAVLGLGGEWSDVEEANHAARVRLEALGRTVQEATGRPLPDPGSRQQGPFVKPDSANVVACGFSGHWNTLLVERGAFKRAVLMGLARVGSGV